MQDDDGLITEKEFVEGFLRLQSGIPEDSLSELLEISEGEEHLDYKDVMRLLDISDLKTAIKMPPSHRNEKGHIEVVASREKYFGEQIRKYNTGKEGNNMDFMVARSQEFAMELYEARVASLQRFVAMTVMFHQMGHRVQKFFSHISLGLLAYRMDRTQSILRIATTASPISGSDVKEQMRRLRLMKQIQHAVHVISVAYLNHKAKNKERRLEHLERQLKNA